MKRLKHVKMVVSRMWPHPWGSFRTRKVWIPPLIGDSVKIVLGGADHIAVTWAPELRVWHLHDIIKDQFGYLNRNKMCLSVWREKEYVEEEKCEEKERRGEKRKERRKREKEEKREKKERERRERVPEKIILGFEENPRPNEVLYFSYWPVESWDRDTLIRIKLKTLSPRLGSVQVPPNYSDEDVWAAIVTEDPLALANRMSLTKEDEVYRLSWNPMSRKEWLELYGGK